MDETLISLKTAKLAREKGFNEPVKGFNEPVYSETYEFFDDTVLYVYPGYKPLKEHHIELEENWYLIPSQSLLQKWIREKHNIHICVDLQVCKPSHWYFRIDSILFKDYLYHSEDEQERFSTYEEALEEGLYQALMLIK